MEPAEKADALDGWREALERLLEAYADVQRRALQPALPGTTTRDRRKLSREFGVLRSVRSGESPVGATPRLHWLARHFVAEHLGSRLRLLRGCILVDHQIREDQQDELLARIDRLLPLWPERSAVGFFYRYVVPLAAVIRAAWHFIAGGLTDPQNNTGLFAILFEYAGGFLGILGLGFVIKRGLMLGGSGFRAGVPASLDGRGVYAVEALVFGVLAPIQREAPLDLLLLAVAAPLFVWGLVIGLLLSPLPSWALVAAGLLMTAWWSVLNVVAFVRRRRFGRC